MANKKTALKRAKKEALKRAAMLGAEFIVQELNAPGAVREALTSVPMEGQEESPEPTWDTSVKKAG